MGKEMDVDKQDWNFNDAWYMRLNENLKDADICAKRGDLLGLFRCLEVIRSQMHWRMKKEGSKEEEEIELQLKNGLIEIKQMLRAGQQNVIGALSMAEEKLLEIFEKLNDLVSIYGFIHIYSEKSNPAIAIEEEMG